MFSLVKKIYNYYINRWFLLLKYLIKGGRIHPFSLFLIDGVFVNKGSFTVHKGSIIRVAKGATLVFDKKAWIGKDVEIEAGSHLNIGKDTSIQDHCTLLGNITIGNGCLFAKNVYISSGQHYFDYKPHFFIKDQDLLIRENDGLASKHHASVIIEDDCWIGINTVIMRNITVGKGSVVGSNSVVTHDIPPYTIAAGIPAKVIRSRIELCPPKVISAYCDEDLPYFWKGFYTRKIDLEKNRRLYGGILAENEFMLSMDIENRDLIFIEARYINNKITLLHNNQDYEISGIFDIFSFRLNLIKESLVQFKVHGDHISSLVIRKAWVE